jgi:hypothetical protein
LGDAWSRGFVGLDGQTRVEGPVLPVLVVGRVAKQCLSLYRNILGGHVAEKLLGLGATPAFVKLPEQMARKFLAVGPTEQAATIEVAPGNSGDWNSGVQCVAITKKAEALFIRDGELSLPVNSSVQIVVSVKVVFRSRGVKHFGDGSEKFWSLTREFFVVFNQGHDLGELFRSFIQASCEGGRNSGSVTVRRGGSASCDGHLLTVFV